ncbi:MAG: ATP-grasp fold amidoligase family protein [Lachnospiraceae bacterium]|nr:ATP-grasp fold amidoligase family protein [Lachnospiraceae bacterium]
MSVKDIYRGLLQVSASVLGAPTTKKLDARIRFGRKINLKQPESLADKLCYLELFTEDERKVRCTDKYAVREYVAEKGLEEILVPLVQGPVSRLSQLCYDRLPEQFAMKATHGCGMNLICSSKARLPEEQVMTLAKKWLQEEYPRACIEPHYKKIPKRLIIEEFLEDADTIIDYKFHCFHGEPDFVLVCGSRGSGLQKRLYTTDWQNIDAMVGKQQGKEEFQKPLHLEKMLQISRILAAEFDFVRVDLYEIKGKIYFGELTFSPASGVLPNFSEEFVREKGKLLKL